MNNLKFKEQISEIKQDNLDCSIDFKVENYDQDYRELFFLLKEKYIELKSINYPNYPELCAEIAAEFIKDINDLNAKTKGENDKLIKKLKYGQSRPQEYYDQHFKIAYLHNVIMNKLFEFRKSPEKEYLLNGVIFSPDEYKMSNHRL